MDRVFEALFLFLFLFLRGDVEDGDPAAFIDLWWVEPWKLRRFLQRGACIFRQPQKRTLSFVFLRIGV